VPEKVRPLTVRACHGFAACLPTVTLLVAGRDARRADARPIAPVPGLSRNQESCAQTRLLCAS
jgi:hypothetical protein